MKRITNFHFLILLTIFSFIGCNDDDPVIQPVASEIVANFGAAFDNKSVAGIEVKLSGVDNSYTYTATSNAEGVINFGEVNPGKYNASASIEFTPESYKDFFGITTKQDKVVFSGILENITINKDSKVFNIELKSSRIGSLLFKQIYFAGSHVKEGAVYRDLFFEIYNNSNETIYADGLYFGQLWGRTKSTTEDYTLSNGQYDWSKSLEQTKGDKSNTDFSYADHVYQIPGSGKDHAIAPGESMVIAGTAINHKEPLVVGDKTYSVANPDLTIDLSGADFEVNFIEHFNALGKTPLKTDIDNPSVPNLLITYRLNAKELILDPLGRDSFVLFRTDDISSFAKLPTPDKTSLTETTKRYMQIPNELILDAVETNHTDPARSYPRRLDPSLDGGQAVMPKGSYSSQSIIRKVTKTFGNRKVLQDTNNTTDDFIVIDRPVPAGWN